MNTTDEKLALEVKEMLRWSRRESRRQAFRNAALLGSGAAGGLVGLVFFANEIMAGALAAITAASGIWLLYFSFRRRRPAVISTRRVSSP